METRDADLLRWIQVATPLNAVQEQLAKGETHRIADIIRKISLELLEEAVDAVDRLPRARHQQLDFFSASARRSPHRT